MKGDIGIEQEAAYPIPISLYNCYRTVRHEKRYISGVASYASLLMPHCPVTVVQRYRDGVCSLLFHLCHPYIPLHLEEMIFILVSPIFDCAECTIKLGYRCKKRDVDTSFCSTRGSNLDRTVTTQTSIYAMLHVLTCHTPRIVHTIR